LGTAPSAGWAVSARCDTAAGDLRQPEAAGTLRVGAEAKAVDGRWTVTKAVMSRSARVLMEGAVRVPRD
jgi:2-methylaconitate cis-trans-isomerase PrpF